MPAPKTDASLARKRKNWLSGVHAVQTALTFAPDLQGTVQLAVDEFRKGLGAEVAQLYVSRPAAAEIRLAAASGTPLTPIPESGLQPGHAYARMAIGRAPVLYIPDLGRGEDVEGRHFLLMLDLRTCLGLPLAIRGRILGAVVAFARRPIAADAETISFAETLAGQAAVAIDQAMVRKAVEEPGATAAAVRSATTPTEGLTGSQLAILQLLTEGKSNQQIAKGVHLSENTVKFHIREIFRKFNAHNRVEAAMAAVKRGIF